MKSEPVTRESYIELLAEITNGNVDAYEYLLLMGDVFRAWDDLYDSDAVPAPAMADRIFSELTFNLSRNKFFREHRNALEAFIFTAWNAWKDSNTWKGSEDKLKGSCAWLIRDYCNEIDQLVAWLVGGVEHARNISLKCREFYLNQLVSRGW